MVSIEHLLSVVNELLLILKTAFESKKVLANELSDLSYTYYFRECTFSGHFLRAFGLGTVKFFCKSLSWMEKVKKLLKNRDIATKFYIYGK